MEPYQTLDGIAEASYEEKKSVFVSQASFADTEEKALTFLERARACHRTASHHVYAYVLREGARLRYSDDGEPSKTAGLPTLEVLQHAALTDCVVVTSRYFGGTLLGTGGLVRAYTRAAQLCLDASRRVSMRSCVRGVLQVEYALYEQAARLLEEAGARVETVEFSDRVTLPFLLGESEEEALRVKLRELCRGEADATFSAPRYAPF